MAIESKRGCGYRKVGGLYLASGEFSMGCDRLPFQLDVCPCCGIGISQSRAPKWIQPLDLFLGDHPIKYYNKGIKTHERGCACITNNPRCPVCFPSKVFVDVSFDEKTGETVEDIHGKALLLWIGKAHYKTPQAFVAEGLGQGISRRINAIPKNFKLGKTWVFLAHPEAIHKAVFGQEYEKLAGIFAAFMPTHIERIVKRSDYDTWEELGKDPIEIEEWTEEDIEIFDKLERDIKRGITLVPVPDDDPDHNPEGK